MAMKNSILLCSDLDRTILPNGDAEESPRARLILRRLVRRPEIHLGYVSGRDRRLIQEAIAEYDLPLPDYAVGDVGTTIYELNGDSWHPWKSWFEEIAKDWKGLTQQDLAKLNHNCHALGLQEPEKQNRFKLSYYADPSADQQRLVDQLRRRMSRHGLRCRFIWSVDEQQGVALLDVLPRRASKLHAIRFLMDRKGYRKDRTVFCGDSGNDLDVLTSDLPSVLVKNASEEVQRETMDTVNKNGRTGTLYIARGNFLHMNGNYSAGVLEGLAHFIPSVQLWIKEAADHPDA
jgi:sucrose-6F-phosphate phosphohydrolase